MRSRVAYWSCRANARPVRRPRASMVAALLAIALLPVAAANDPASAAHDGSPAGEPTSRATATAVVGPDGGTLLLADVVQLYFPQGTFMWRQEVSVVVTHDAESRALFDNTATAYGVRARLPYEVRINTGAQAPRAGIGVTFTVPSGFRDELPSGAAIRLFGRNLMDEDGIRLAAFEPCGLSASPARGSMDVHIPTVFFSNAQTPDRSYEAILTLAASY